MDVITLIGAGYKAKARLIMIFHEGPSNNASIVQCYEMKPINQADRTQTYFYMLTIRIKVLTV